MTRHWHVLTLLTAFNFVVTSSRAKAHVVQAFFNHNKHSQFREPYRNIVRTGDDFETLLLAEIAKAKSRVWIAVHEFRLPHIAHLLAQKQKEGVDVRIILENQYSSVFPFRKKHEIDELPFVTGSRYRDYFFYIDQNKDDVLSQDELNEHDVPSYLIDKKIPFIDDTVDGSKGAGLMHHKFVLIDQTKVIVTSANFTWSDFYGDFLNKDSRGNANHLVVIENPELNTSFETQFLEMWQQHRFGSSKVFQGKTVVSTKASQGMWVQFAPTSQKIPWPQSALGSINESLANAQKSIDIAQFVFSEQKISDTLQRWTGPSKKLRALVDKDFAYQSYSELLDILGLKLLDRFCNFENGNNPWLRPQTQNMGSPRLASGDKFHHKFAVIDNAWIIFGSLNWSESGNLTNDETIVALQDTTVAAQFTEEFEGNLSQAYTRAPPWLAEQIAAKEASCSSSKTAH